MNEEEKLEMANISLPQKMSGVFLTGHGGFEVLDYREDILVPTIKADEVLIKVGACGVNNIDIYVARFFCREFYPT